MMETKIACIVIPVYKPFEKLDHAEIASLVQCFKILNNYSIYLIGPRNFNYKPYVHKAKEFNVFLKYIPFSDHYFTGLAGYNKLLISKLFIKSFKQHNYMLIYQLDAWVFKDELEYWCKQGFDYIGAPWFESLSEANENSKYFGVGNGGFSLRNVQSQLKAISSFSYLKAPNSFYLPFKERPSLGNLLYYIRNISIQNNTFFLFNNYDFQEDFFWGRVIPEKFKWFKVADLDVASRFSMEVNGPTLYKTNNCQLPFGCHAWERYDKIFWERFIDATVKN